MKPSGTEPLVISGGGTAMCRTRIARIITSLAAAAVLVSADVAAIQPAPAHDSQPSLYERLGGVYSIATVVDDFIERLLVDATLNANPAISQARARVPKAGLKFQVTALVCGVTGGPCKYTGRGMKEAHQHLNINQVQWDAMLADFKVTLAKFKVPEREQQELIAIVESTKSDIVSPSTARSPGGGR
jgi:hemoglobin